jgi:hypothetical protein
VICFGSVDNPAVVKALDRWAADLQVQPGRIEPIKPHSLEDSTCEHCGQIIVRDGAGFGWKHYPSFKKECHPRPTASPKRDAFGNAIPLVGK